MRTDSATARRTTILRAAAVAAALTAPLVLSGCFPKPLDVSRATRVDVPSEDAEVELETEDAAGDELDFEDGALLSASSTAEWADGLVVDDGWTLTSPDDGNGNWGYTSADGACTVAYWQGYLSDIDTSSGDDAVVSDKMLAMLLGASDADIAEYAFDGGFAYQTSGNDDVANRSVVGDDGTTAWMMSARALTQPGLGFTTTIDCTGGQDPEDVAEQLNELSAIIVLP